MTLIDSLTRRSVGSNRESLIAAGIFAVCYGAVLFVTPFERNGYAFNNFVVLMTPLAIAAVGTTLVLITGGFDLSVAGTISLSNVIAATTMAEHPDAVWLIALVVIGVGLLVGLINGMLVVRAGLQSLAVTLGTFIVLTGVALIVLPAPGGEVPESYALALTDPLGPVPVALLVLLALALAWGSSAPHRPEWRLTPSAPTARPLGCRACVPAGSRFCATRWQAGSMPRRACTSPRSPPRAIPTPAGRSC